MISPACFRCQTTARNEKGSVGYAEYGFEGLGYPPAAQIRVSRIEMSDARPVRVVAWAKTGSERGVRYQTR